MGVISMPRATCLSLIAALACSCGGGSADKNQETPAALPTAPITSTPPVSTAESTSALPLFGAPRRNNVLQLAVNEAGFDPAAPAAPPGLRYFTVGLHGTSLSRSADVAIEIQPFVFAQNDRGCISRPILDASWLKRPFGETAVFTSSQSTKGQLAFLVPDDTRSIRVLISSASGGLVVSAGDDFTPAWPTPTKVIEDGSTLRVLVLPKPSLSTTLPPPATGREHVVLDIVIENLADDQGIEFTTSQQLRLIDPNGQFVQPAALTKRLGCRLDDGDVIPPGHVRRLMAVYDMPAGVPRRLQYRGFEVDEVTVDLE